MISLITWLGVALGLASAFFLVTLHRRTLRGSGRRGESHGGLIITGVGEGQENKAAEPAPSPARPPEKSPPGPRKNRKAVPEDAEDGPVLPKPSAKSLADILQAPTGLQGTLAQVPVQDFLQFLAQGKRTGVLNVASGRRHGYVKFAEGRIVHCSFRGRYGLTALQAMLQLREGDFEFFEGSEAHLPSQAEGGVAHPPLDVVETLLQFDVRNRAGVQLPSEDGKE